MTFRRRLTMLIGGSVGVAIVLASGLGYVAVRSQLRSEVDDSLREKAAEVIREAPYKGLRAFDMEVQAGDPDAYLQIVYADGTPTDSENTTRIPLPITGQVRRVAAGDGDAMLYDVQAGGDHVRAIVIPIKENGAPAGAIAFGRSLREVDHVLDRLRWIFVLAAIGGVALAVVLGRAIAGRAITPLRRLTETAEHVARTRDLARRIETDDTDDEIASMATSFNAMLDALEQSITELDASVKAQRQLVADASHELRTPITSLRTNLEILRTRAADLAPERRAALLDTVVEQTEELTVLMNDVIELARGDEPVEGRQTLHLEELLDEALERAARHSPDTIFVRDIHETTVIASASRIARAINNLLDNAVKWNAPGEPVEVTLRDGVLRVRDHGPGIPEDELPQVFDRFFRGARSRDRPGSGLGLAIVRQVADEHGGTVTAYNAQGGGAILELRLPVVDAMVETDPATTTA